MFGPLGARRMAQKVATRLKFPQAFTLFLILFLVDLAVPDLIPFADEILLGLATVLFGLWREPAPPGPDVAPRPPEKNVTPPRG